MTRVANPDRMRLAILYLRLWKICDAEFDGATGYDSAKHYDIVSIDTARFKDELRQVAESSLEWVNDPREVRDDIGHTLDLIDAMRRDRSANNLAALDALRQNFQKKAFDLAGEIELANEAGG